mmetsp:Transcript_1569/g.4007  ORF Transcript_1569/g.4007 Transcript_1569/m.4007 type:complete len:271 (-) Transcript_1569:175-987(-)
MRVPHLPHGQRLPQPLRRGRRAARRRAVLPEARQVHHGREPRLPVLPLPHPACLVREPARRVRVHPPPGRLRLELPRRPGRRPPAPPEAWQAGQAGRLAHGEQLSAADELQRPRRPARRRGGSEAAGIEVSGVDPEVRRGGEPDHPGHLGGAPGDLLPDRLPAPVAAPLHGQRRNGLHAVDVLLPGPADERGGPGLRLRAAGVPLRAARQGRGQEGAGGGWSAGVLLADTEAGRGDGLPLLRVLLGARRVPGGVRHRGLPAPRLHRPAHL